METRDLYKVNDIVVLVKTRRMRWAGHFLRREQGSRPKDVDFGSQKEENVRKTQAQLMGSSKSEHQSYGDYCGRSSRQRDKRGLLVSPNKGISGHESKRVSGAHIIIDL